MSFTLLLLSTNNLTRFSSWFFIRHCSSIVEINWSGQMATVGYAFLPKVALIFLLAESASLPTKLFQKSKQVSALLFQEHPIFLHGRLFFPEQSFSIGISRQLCRRQTQSVALLHVPLMECSEHDDGAAIQMVTGLFVEKRANAKIALDTRAEKVFMIVFGLERAYNCR